MPPTPDPNGREKLAVTLGNKSIGLTTANLPLILLIFCGLVGGYVIWRSMDANQQRIEARVGEVLEMQQALYRDVQHHWIRLETQITEQEKRLAQQLEMEAERLRLFLLRHEYNQAREPGERIPLELPQTPGDGIRR